MRFILAILTFACISVTIAQNRQPDYGQLFLQDELARVDILLPEDTVTLMYDSIYYAAEHEFEATFVYSTSFSVDTIPSVGFRFRGNTSIEAAKKNFKISFNTFTNGGQFLGVEKLNLNGEHNDVSLSRSKLSWELLREMDLPASRTSYVRVYVNEVYAGLYLNVEHIDEEFVKKRYAQKEGNLYKCLWPATLEYWGSSQDAYKAMQGDRRIYDLKTNTYRDDYSRFAHFIDVLNNTSETTFRCEIEKVFNVDDYLKIAAIDVLIGNWDGYIFNKNNYYLYENPVSGRIDYIPYDLDNTWGVDWFGEDWTQQSIYNWNAQSRPLYDRLMGIPKYREQFSFYIDELMNGPFSEAIVAERLQSIQDQIASAVEEDMFYTFDYGFSYADFLISADSAWGEHVQYGVLPYIQERRESALAELESFNDPHVIKEVRDSLMDFDTHLIRAWIEGETDDVSIFINEGDVFASMTMYDDGEHMDGQAGDGEYAVVLSQSDWGDFADFQVMSQQGFFTESEPCDTRRVWFDQAEGPLYINELMLANDFVIFDEAGEFDDWLEIFNPGPSAVYLGNYYLTDNIHCPNKWQLPAESLTNIAFQLIWADKDEEQGDYHANFKLSSSGEELALFGMQNGSLRLIDYVDFPAMVPNHSWGRLTDAEEPWVVFSTSTPEASNSGGVVGVSEQQQDQFRLYPNPSTGQIFIEGINARTVRIFDINGRLALAKSLSGSVSLELEQLDGGVYQMMIEDEKGDWYRTRFILNP